MSTETKPRRRRELSLPDLDAEQEVDFGRYWNAILARWWLLLAGLAAGIILGYLASLGGNDVFQAKATVYMGQPVTPTGSVPVTTSATSPTIVRQIIFAESTIRAVAARVGLRRDELRGHISMQTQSTTGAAATRQGQAPVVSISVTGPLPRKVARAANELAQTAVERTGSYVRDKVGSLRSQLTAQKAELNSIDRLVAQYQNTLGRSGLSPTDRLVVSQLLALEIQERRQVTDQQAITQAQLSFAQSVESPQVIARGAPVKTTARSRRNSALVGAAIGLLIGILAALLWEPVSRFARRSRL